MVVRAELIGSILSASTSLYLEGSIAYPLAAALTASNLDESLVPT